MSTTYRLSGRQAKEMLTRGRPLRLAIPVPLDEPADPLAYCRSVLRDVGGLVRSAEPQAVAVTPSTGTDGLTGCLGVLLSPEDAASTLHVCVDVYVVEVAPDSPRGRPSLLQWPGSAHCGDKIWPRPKGGSE